MKNKVRNPFSIFFAFILLLSLFLSVGGQVLTFAEDELTGKKIIDTYDSGSLKSTEPVYKTGNMYAVTSNEAWTDQTACKASPDWTGAKYVMVYVHNLSNAEDCLGLLFNYNDQYHYTPKVGTSLYLDDMNTVTAVTVEDFGSYRFGVKIPAGFKGYLKCQLTDLSQYDKVWNQENPAWTSLASMLAVNYSSKNFSVAVDTLTISYDDDMMTPLTEETALFGRDPSQIVELEGKKLLDSYDDAAYYSHFFQTKQSTQSNYPGLMYKPKQTDGSEQWWSDELPSSDNKDWAGAEYIIVYVDNQSDTESQFSFGLHQNGEMIRLKTGAQIYWDNGQTSQKVEVLPQLDTGFWTGIKIPAGEKGYVKIPFVSTLFEERYTADPSVVLNTEGFVDKASYNVTGDIYVDTLAISYDADIEEVFDGIFSNRRALDLTSSEQNEFRVIENFYEVNWKRDWFDRAPNGMAGEKGSVTYSEIADSMTVTWNAVSGTLCMWGHDNTITGEDRDWTSAKYMVNEVVNNTEKEVSYRLLTSNGNTNVNVSIGALYYLKDAEGNVTACVAKDSKISLPAKFEGLVIIPAESYGNNLDMSAITRYSLEFDLSESGSITFKHMGYAVSDKILIEDAAVIDNSKYFVLPPDIILQPAPPRPSTEPDTAIENNVKE